MVTGAKLFTDDFATFNYSTNRLLPLGAIWWPSSLESHLAIDDPLHPLEMIDAVMLNVDRQKRPKARDVRRLLEMLRAGTNLPGFPREDDVIPGLQLQVFNSRPLQMNCRDTHASGSQGLTLRKIIWGPILCSHIHMHMQLLSQANLFDDCAKQSDRTGSVTPRLFVRREAEWSLHLAMGRCRESIVI